MEPTNTSNNVYEGLQEALRDSHIYSQQNVANNYAASAESVDIEITGQKRAKSLTTDQPRSLAVTPWKVIIAPASVVLFICAIMCTITGLVVYHVVSASIPNTGTHPANGGGVRSTETAAISKTLNDLDGEVQTLLSNISQLSEVERKLEEMANSKSDQSLETDGWELIFRATSGNGYNVYTAWTIGRDITEVKPTNMDRGMSHHYRDSSKVKDWSNVHMVKYALYENGQQVAHIVFNGTGSTNMDWFDKNRVLDASWSPVKNHKVEYNYFSIVGHHLMTRRFFVNVDYGSSSAGTICSGDLGYLLVDDMNSGGSCLYEKLKYPPQFLYSKINSAEFWNMMMFGRADYMAIFYKTM